MAWFKSKGNMKERTNTEEKLQEIKYDASHLSKSIQWQLTLVGLTTGDMEQMEDVSSFISDHIEQIVESFYQRVLLIPELQGIIQSHSTVERLRKTLRQHILSTFTKEITPDFIEHRRRISLAHVKVNLEPKWYIAAFQYLNMEIATLLLTHIENRHKVISMTQAVSKLLSFEMQLVLETYQMILTEQRQEEEEKKHLVKNQITATSQEVAAVTEQTTASIEEMTTNLDAINEALHSTSNEATNVQRLSDDGESYRKLLENGIFSMSQNMGYVTDQVHSLQGQTKRMSEIVSMTKGVSDQIGLLALNASIEAARAGEYGRGFEVVANEVRMLASQSNTYSEQINDLIQGVTRLIHEVSNMITETDGAVKNINEHSADVKSSFEGIAKGIQLNTESIRKITQKTEQLNAAGQDIRQAAFSMSTVASGLAKSMNDF